MATASVPNTFVNGTTADADQVNANFSALVSFLNNQVLHRDGSKTLTGDLDAASHRIINLPTPNGNSQPATKQYVDSTVFSAATFEVSNSTEVASATLPPSLVAVATVNLSIPGSWNTWRTEAFATYVIWNSSGSDLLHSQVRLLFGSDPKQIKELWLRELTYDDGAVGGRHAASNVSQVHLQARAVEGGGLIQDIYLFARAIRTG